MFTFIKQNISEKKSFFVLGLFYWPRYNPFLRTLHYDHVMSIKLLNKIYLPEDMPK